MAQYEWKEYTGLRAWKRERHRAGKENGMGVSGRKTCTFKWWGDHFLDAMAHRSPFQKTHLETASVNQWLESSAQIGIV